MKKILVFLAVTLLVLSGCQIESKQAVKNQNTNFLDGVKSMGVKDFENSIGDPNKTFLAYIRRESCSDCNSFEPEFLSYLEKKPLINKNLYAVETSEIYKEKDKWENFKRLYKIEGTPSFVYVKNGEIFSTTGWTVEKGFSISLFNRWINDVV